MKFALLVQGSPKDTKACDQALSFARAVVRKKHTLERVFFYKDAVRIAGDSSDLSVGAATCSRDWLEFAERNQTELQVCVSACERREISVEQPSDSSSPCFEVVGLGQFVESAIKFDRVVTFN